MSRFLTLAAAQLGPYTVPTPAPALSAGLSVC